MKKAGLETIEQQIDSLLKDKKATVGVAVLANEYGVDVTSEMTGVKPRRLYYIRQAYRDRNTDMHMGERSLVIAKSRHNNKNFYLVIDTMYDSDLLDYFNSPKLALNYVL